MRKVKLDSKSEKSANPFFDIEHPDKDEALSFAHSASAARIARDETFTDEHKYFTKFLKQAFIFLPGTFLLFFMSYGAAIIAMEIFVSGRAVETLPDDFAFQSALIGLIVLAGSLMTWFGLGDIKNRKHFAIPASLVISGAIIGAVVKATASLSDLADKILDDFSYLIYFLPLALIIPILAKSIVDRKVKDAK